MRMNIRESMRWLGILLAISAACCNRSAPQQRTAVLLGVTRNLNSKCIGHTAGLCGPEATKLPVEIAGVFATEPDCQGLTLRGLTKQEEETPSNKLPFLFDLFYEGSPHTDRYYGTGKDEDEGWMLMFNGPNGHFSARVKTERDAVRRVCLAAKGQGGKIDASVGYSH
jgi:hypothetical protein